MTRLLPFLLLTLAACETSTPPPVTPVAMAGPAGATSPSVAASPAVKPPPYQGPPGSCSLDGLASPLYAADDPHWGEAGAPVAIVLFSDFQCPHCARQRLVLDDIKSHYGPTRLQIIWKNMPLSMHRNARPAAEASQAVLEAGGADAFWRFHDLVFTNHRSISDEQLAAWAQQAGVDPAAYAAARARPSVAAHVNGDVALARSIGVNGTPMMIVNGVALEGVQDPSSLSALIDEMLAGAPATPAVHHACDRMRESWAPAR